MALNACTTLPQVLGTPLRVRLPAGLSKGSSISVGVRFATSPASSAIQFLEPQQTAGGQHPYLFTQCQAIHARALVPCQVCVQAAQGMQQSVGAVPCLRAGDVKGRHGVGAAP
eukprot:358897-Chlamydomonas_euryale.AAC.16